MRRPWLLPLLLAAPVVAAAQAAPPPQPGQITFPTVPLTATDQFINAAECASGTIELTWLIDATTVGVREYQLYATNKTTTTDDCPTTDGDKQDDSLLADSVGAAITSELRNGQMTRSFPTNEIAEAVDEQACDETANLVVGLCIQAKDGSGNNVGTARGTVTLSLGAPAAPQLVSVGPGEEALKANWNPDDSATQSRSFEALARSVDPAFLASADPTTLAALDPATLTTVDALDPALHSSGRVTPDEARIEGLVNGVTYAVAVLSFSDADNPSPRSATLLGTPEEVNDFFEQYRAAGGVEEGGCASGSAGPVAIGAVALLLATLGRRRRA